MFPVSVNSNTVWCEKSDQPIKYKDVNATADGDNTVIAAVVKKRIRVLAYSLQGVGAAAGAVIVKGSGGTTLAHFEFTATAASLPASFNGPFPAFQTPEGEGLVINNAVGTDTLGHITYVEV